MVTQKAIRIYGDSHKTYLDISLHDILAIVKDGEKYSWSILWLQAIGEIEQGVVSLEDEIKKREEGLIVDWSELQKLSLSLDQVIEILLIGDWDRSKLHKYGSDQELYNSCEMVMELIDSTYWEVDLKDESMRLNLLAHFKNAIEL